MLQEEQIQAECPSLSTRGWLAVSRFWSQETRDRLAQPDSASIRFDPRLFHEGVFSPHSGATSVFRVGTDLCWEASSALLEKSLTETLLQRLGPLQLRARHRRQNLTNWNFCARVEVVGVRGTMPLSLFSKSFKTSRTGGKIPFWESSLELRPRS